MRGDKMINITDMLENLTTETINENSKTIDRCSTKDILTIINEEDKKVALAITKVIPNIERAVDEIYKKLNEGGRLFYIGAGTSGRIGILDASECPPTFGTCPELIQGIIAGGNDAIIKAVEGAEDDENLGIKAIYDKNISSKDAIIGIAASGRTPFVLGAIREAKRLGALTIGISNNELSILKNEANIEITPIVGPEVIMGSTRMKAGTSQKMILNMISTSVMIKMGKVYGNLMVDLKATNLKLKDRCVRIVMKATGVSTETAQSYLNQSDFNPKIAIMMIEKQCDKNTATILLDKSHGVISKALNLN